MFVLFENCHNHYDDSNESPKCESSHRPGWKEHLPMKKSAISEHIYNTMTARGLAPDGWPQRRQTNSPGRARKPPRTIADTPPL